MQITNDAFVTNPNLVVVGGDALVVEASGQQIGHLRMPRSPAAISAASFFYNPIAHPTVAINFSALKRYGAGYAKDFINVLPTSERVPVTVAQDYYLFGQLALMGPCINIGVPLIKYRRHRESVGSTKGHVQLELSLQISCFLAKSFCKMHAFDEFDPRPFCNHADYVFNCGMGDYSEEYWRMVSALRRGLGDLAELERELAFRWLLATRNSAKIAYRYLRFRRRHGSLLTEYRTVRNWLLRGFRNGKYVYTAK